MKSEAKCIYPLKGMHGRAPQTSTARGSLSPRTSGSRNALLTLVKTPVLLLGALHLPCCAAALCFMLSAVVSEMEHSLLCMGAEEMLQ